MPTAPQVDASKSSVPEIATQTPAGSVPTNGEGEAKAEKLIEPLQVRIVSGDKLTSFERKTVGFNRYGLLISGASFIAALVAAWVFFGQLKETSKQTDLLDITAEQARTDAKNSALATARQLAAVQAQITVAQTGTAAFEGQLKEARRMTDLASEQLRITDRPWVGVWGQLSIIGSIHDNAAATNFVYNLANNGKSVALGVSDGVWVAGGAANGYKLMDSDHCEQMAKSQRQAIALWEQWKKTGGTEPGGVTPKTGALILPGAIGYIQTAPQEGAPAVHEDDIYVLVCTTYFDQLDNVHLTQNMYCLTSQFPKLSDTPIYCAKGNYAY